MADHPEVLPTLAELEAIVAANMPGFIKAANALMQIRENRLYLETHRSWKGYCWERWQISPDAADRRIDQGRVAAALPPGSPIPSQRSIARDRRRAAHPTQIMPTTSTDTTEVRGTSTPATPIAPEVSPISSVVAESYDDPPQDRGEFERRKAETLEFMHSPSETPPVPLVVSDAEVAVARVQRFEKAVAELRIFPVDVAARLSTARTYADVMEWMLGFRAAYQHQHPVGRDDTLISERPGHDARAASAGDLGERSRPPARTVDLARRQVQPIFKEDQKGKK